MINGETLYMKIKRRWEEGMIFELLLLVFLIRYHQEVSNVSARSFLFLLPFFNISTA